MASVISLTTFRNTGPPWRHPGGAVVVYDPLLDDDRGGPVHVLLGSLTISLTTPGGSLYTYADCRGWMREAGFDAVTVTELADPDKLVTGRK